jgi:hypothetical protein
MWGSVSSRPLSNGSQVRTRRSARRRTDNGVHLAALRGVTAARGYLQGAFRTLAEAARSCGSNVRYVQAGLIVLKSENQGLLELVLQGYLPLPAAAARVKRVVELVSTYRDAKESERIAFARACGVDSLLADLVAAE